MIILVIIIIIVDTTIIRRCRCNPDNIASIDIVIIITTTIIIIIIIIIIVIIIIIRRCRCNPDNIATPIAASLGDVVTLGLLAWISDVLYNDYNDGEMSSSSSSAVSHNDIPQSSFLVAFVSYKYSSPF